MADSPTLQRKWYRRRKRDSTFRQRDSGESSSESDTGPLYQIPVKRARANLLECNSSTSHSSSETQEHLDSDVPFYSNAEEEGSSPENSIHLDDQDNLPIENLLRAGEGNLSGKSEDGEDSGSGSNRGSDSEHSEQSEQSEHDLPSSDEEDLQDVHDQQPLYDGAPINVRESALAILSFALSHSLSGVCISDLLSLIALHCGPGSHCFKSIYLFKKYFAMQANEGSVRHYFCSGCELPLETKNTVCDNCNGNSEVSYFLEFSLSKQLRGMYKRPQFYEALQFKSNRVKKVENNIEDMFDGNIYKECTASGFLSNPNNISFAMFFDGLAVYKKSKLQLWPIYLSINELRYKDRTKKENILIAGLWFGKHKPNPNLFLQPICVSLQRLQFEGLNLELPNGHIVHVKGRVISAVGDLPAKALFMRLAQYNGLYSCFYCTSSGARYGLGRNTVQVFPYLRNFELRTSAEMFNFANEALLARQVDEDATVYGVKGPSQLAVCLPDFIRCGGLDVMHSCFLGLMRSLVDFWFNTTYSEFPFSISNCVDIVDSRLKKIKPPFSFQRLPCSLKNESAMMKASDYKMFFFFYSIPVLCDILPPLYWEHHCKIVSALTLLSQNSISEEQINTAEELIHSYVSDFANLYNLRYLGLNLHQLLHLCSVIRNLGPSWVYSCFFYESLNGLLLKLIHGTRYAALQVTSAASACLNLSLDINNMPEGETKELCLRFLSTMNRRHKIAEIIDNNTSVLGVYHDARLTPYVRRLLQDKFNIGNEGRFMEFFRIKKKGLIYSSKNYERSKKKISCFVEVYQDETPYLGKIQLFVRWSACGIACPKLCLACPKRFICIVELYDRVPWQLQDLGLTVPHLSKVTPTGRSVAFTIDSLTYVCLYMQIDGNEFMCTPVNTLEVE